MGIYHNRFFPNYSWSWFSLIAVEHTWSKNDRQHHMLFLQLAKLFCTNKGRDHNTFINKNTSFFFIVTKGLKWRLMREWEKQTTTDGRLLSLIPCWGRTFFFFSAEGHHYPVGSTQDDVSCLLAGCFSNLTKSLCFQQRISCHYIIFLTSINFLSVLNSRDCFRCPLFTQLRYPV